MGQLMNWVLDHPWDQELARQIYVKRNKMLETRPKFDEWNRDRRREKGEIKSKPVMLS